MTAVMAAGIDPDLWVLGLPCLYPEEVIVLTIADWLIVAAISKRISDRRLFETILAAIDHWNPCLFSLEESSAQRSPMAKGEVISGLDFRVRHASHDHEDQRGNLDP